TGGLANSERRSPGGHLVLPTITHRDYFEPPLGRAQRGGAGIAALLVVAVLVTLLVAAGLAGGGAVRGLAAARGTATLPAAARGPVSAAVGRQAPAYRVNGLHARNPAQRLRATFSPAGATIAAGHAGERVRLSGFGRATALQDVAPVTPRVTANRVDYAHAGVREWWTNGPLGLEQGFDVRSRPGNGRGPLTLSLGLAGDLRARQAGAGVALEGKGQALRYGGLSATDARGRALRARLAVDAGRVQIEVDDRDAAYPIRVDPFVAQAG
ncbi:MAG TPA: hypothetical protein VHR88_06490, partial [Solirubrobacteraceae bacterium]|nr:hypothetical protein [Solirubrobacteraceae bacterium]